KLVSVLLFFAKTSKRGATVFQRLSCRALRDAWSNQMRRSRPLRPQETGFNPNALWQALTDAEILQPKPHRKPLATS
ncbi:MAG TPA: hypothetical protein VF014_12190, partial [Casimicrobiaceae bacterium]|nr:hypothetical protein [Casimicrobiaceae bacterium]